MRNIPCLLVLLLLLGCQQRAIDQATYERLAHKDEKEYLEALTAQIEDNKRLQEFERQAQRDSIQSDEYMEEISLPEMTFKDSTLYDVVAYMIDDYTKQNYQTKDVIMTMRFGPIDNRDAVFAQLIPISDLRRELSKASARIYGYVAHKGLNVYIRAVSDECVNQYVKTVKGGKPFTAKVYKKVYPVKDGTLMEWLWRPQETPDGVGYSLYFRQAGW